MNYEQVYKMKSDFSEGSHQELSSLNNNYSIEENERNLEPFSNFFEFSNSENNDDFQLNFEEPEIFEPEEQIESLDLASANEVRSTGQTANTCICVKCQKDIRNDGGQCLKFWQKGNKLTLCQSECGSQSNLLEQSLLNQDCVPFELDFEIPDLKIKDIEIDEIKKQLGDVEEWAKSLTGASPEEKVLTETEEQNETQMPDTPVKNDQGSTDVESSEIIGDIEFGIDTSVNQELKSGFKSHASQYSWSQHQSFHKALEGKADLSATKGSSDKEINALSIRRSCFRALSSHFKNTFSKFNRAWQDKKRNKKKTKNMNEFIDTYIQQEFGVLVGEMHPEFFIALRQAVIAILHSHRYKKEEEFTKDIDFSVIRDVLYSYTLDARHRFVSDPSYALIYHHFFVSGAYKFLNSQVQCKSKTYVFELEKELVTLHEDALITLNSV